MSSSATTISSIQLDVFQAMPGNSVVLLPDTPHFTIIAATDDFCKASGRNRADILGLGMFEAFPGNLNEYQKKVSLQFRESLTTVLQNKIPDRMPLVRYDVQTAVGKVEERYWLATNTPVLAKDGQVSHIIHTTEDVTMQVKVEKNARRIQSLESSYNIFMQAPVTIGVVKGSNYIIELANDNLLEVWGKSLDVVGKPLFEAIPELAEQGFKILLDQVLETEEPFLAFEYPIRLNRYGKEEVLYFDFIYKPYYESSQAKPIGVLAVGHDVTKHVESRQKFKSVIAEAKNPILILMGEELVLDTANQALLDLWQVGPESVGKPFLEILPEMEAQGFAALLKNVLHTGEPFYGMEQSAVFKRKTGEEEKVYFDFSYQPYRSAEGIISGVLVIATDVTGQVLARRKIEESESHFRLMADTVPAIIWITEKDGSCTYLNKRWYDCTGQTEAEALGFGWLTVVHPEDADRSKKTLISSYAKGDAFHLLNRLRQKDGNYRWSIHSGEPRYDSEGNVSGYIGSIIDVHDQIVLEEHMRRSEERYRHLFQNSPVAKWDQDFTAVNKTVNKLVKAGITDFDTYFATNRDELLGLVDSIVVNDVNEAALRMWDGSKDELLSGLQKFFIEDTLPAFLDEIKVIAQGGGRFESETTVQSKMGEKINVLVRIDFPAGEDYSSVPVILVNITERKKAEEALRESESRFRTLAEALPQMVWIRTMDGIIEYGSKQWEEYSGIHGVSAAWRAMVHPDDWKPVMSAWEKDGQEGRAYRYEVRLKNKDGEYRWHYASGEPIRNANGEVIKWIGAMTDIHAQKTFAEKLETEVAARTRELRNSEKKLEQAVKELERSNEDLQQFAHVASHDLKEPVRKVLTFMHRLKDQLGTSVSAQAAHSISKIESASLRMYSMIDGVLLYSSLNALEQTKEVIDLNEVIQSIEVDLEVMIVQKGADLRYQDLPSIEGSSILIYQLFYNLINNSIKFARTDEKLLIEISTEKVDEQELISRGLNNGVDYLKIALTDNGIGFNQSHADRIFQTFTRLHAKDKYEGTGLGLSLCRKIVERHGGIIYAEGSEGKGARFNILLPQPDPVIASTVSDIN